MPNVPDFKAFSLLSTGNTAVQSQGHCGWQIGTTFIAKLQMYWVRQPANNCHQIASKCTKSHTNYKSFPEVIPPDDRRMGALPQTPILDPIPDWESEKVATLVTQHGK